MCRRAAVYFTRLEFQFLMHCTHPAHPTPNGSSGRRLVGKRPATPCARRHIQRGRQQMWYPQPAPADRAPFACYTAAWARHGGYSGLQTAAAGLKRSKRHEAMARLPVRYACCLGVLLQLLVSVRGRAGQPLRTRARPPHPGCSRGSPTRVPETEMICTKRWDPRGGAMCSAVPPLAAPQLLTEPLRQNWCTREPTCRHGKPLCCPTSHQLLPHCSHMQAAALAASSLPAQPWNDGPSTAVPLLEDRIAAAASAASQTCHVSRSRAQTRTAVLGQVEHAACCAVVGRSMHATCAADFDGTHAFAGGRCIQRCSPLGFGYANCPTTAGSGCSRLR